MGVVLVVLAAVVVFAIAAGTVGVVVDRLAQNPTPTVLKVADEVDWIAERVPFEVAARISHADVGRIIGWHLETFADAGMATEFGQELGGEAVPVESAPRVDDLDAAVDAVVVKAMAAGSELTALEIVVVLDLHLQYLRAIGAIGPVVDDVE